MVRFFFLYSCPSTIFTTSKGFYDTQYADRDHPDCRGRLRSDAEGGYSFRAVVPVPYPIPGDGPVGELLLALNRHNMVNAFFSPDSGLG